MYDENGKRISDEVMKQRLDEIFDTNAELRCENPNGSPFSAYTFRMNARNRDRVAESVATYKRAGWKTFILTVDGESPVSVTDWG